MKRNPSRFFPFEKPLYSDLVFYIFLAISINGMSKDLEEFYNFGDSSRLIPLLIQFANSIFVAWVISIPINWIRDQYMKKIKTSKSDNFENNTSSQDLKITKLNKPIGEMNSNERADAAKKLSEIMMGQIKNYNKRKNK